MEETEEEEAFAVAKAETTRLAGSPALAPPSASALPPAFALALAPAGGGVSAGGAVWLEV